VSRARIVIDGRLLAYRFGGIQRYVRSLTTALARVEHGFDVRLACNRPVSAPIPTVRVCTPPHHRLERWSLGLELTLHRPALVHSTDFIPPRLPPFVRSVATVHDLAFLDHPLLLPVEARRYYGQLVRALPRADRIIAVSQWTASALQAHCPQLADRVVVIHNGVDDDFFVPPTDPWRVLERTLSWADCQVLWERALLLAVGTVEPRKRYALLLGALQRLRLAWDAPQAILVVVGQMGWCDDGAVAGLIAAVERGEALWLQRADDEVLRALYAVATLLVVPSLDEGFCLPAAEAMAAGLPVLAAHRGALPEVVGEAGHLVDSDSPDAWAAEIAALINDHSRRRVLAARGRDRAQRFRWDVAAGRTLTVYKEVLG